MLASLFEEEIEEGSSPNTTRCKGSVSPFAVDIADGRRIRVETSGILWGAAESQSTGNQPTRVDVPVVIEVRQLETDASILVAGRLRDGAFVSTSPESLLAYGADDAARAVLARAAWSGRALRLALAVGIVVLIVIAIFHPGLPPMNIPSSD